LALHSILLPVNVTRLAQIQIARASGKRLLARSTDPAPEDDLARPIYLNRQALADPPTALSLAEREQQRVACMLASRLARSGETAPASGPDRTGRAAATLLDKIDLFLTGLATGGGLSAAQMTHLTGLRSRDEVLRALHETLGELAGRLRDPGAHLPDWLAEALSEGLGTILRMTSDRSALVERLRSRAMTSWTDGDTSDQGAVYVVTALYERTVWLLRRYAHLLETVAAMQADQPANIAEAETV